MNPVVSVESLKANLSTPGMVILNTSFQKPGVRSDAILDERLIPYTRFF